MDIPVLRHTNCTNTDCDSCLVDHVALGKYLEAAIQSARPRDYLGEYHRWLKQRGINPETIHGWATAAAFYEGNIAAFIAEEQPNPAPTGKEQEHEEKR